MEWSFFHQPSVVNVVCNANAIVYRLATYSLTNKLHSFIRTTCLLQRRENEKSGEQHLLQNNWKRKYIILLTHWLHIAIAFGDAATEKILLRVLKWFLTFYCTPVKVSFFEGKETHFSVGIFFYKNLWQLLAGSKLFVIVPSSSFFLPHCLKCWIKDRSFLLLRNKQLNQTERRVLVS